MVVIGIGTSRQDRDVYGYCTLFSRDGRFRLGKSSAAADNGSWKKGLPEFVEAQLSLLAEEDQWERGAPVRLIFHFSDAVDPQLIGELKAQLQASHRFSYNSRYTFLLIGYRHPHRFFEPRSRMRMPLVPRRGHGQQQEDQVLLQLRNLDDEQIEGAPLRVWLHPESDEKDLAGLATQVYRFSNLTWCGTDPEVLPATLIYGNLLTERLHAMERAGFRETIEMALTEHPDLKTWFL